MILILIGNFVMLIFLLNVVFLGEIIKMDKLII